MFFSLTQSHTVDMKTPSPCADNSCKKEKWFNLGKPLAPFLLCSLGVTTFFSLFILYSPNPFKATPKQSLDWKPTLLQLKNDDENCDLNKGHWVPVLNGSLYTNWSCATIPDSKNCFKHGRRDTDFVNWRWKPENCELPQFDPKTFLQIVKGKKLAFIGDSVARNHMESLLCILSKEETPTLIHKDAEDRTPTWRFSNHDFTLTILWTRFLVMGEARVINGSESPMFNLYLDKIDTQWTRNLSDVDYAVISDSHWFFRILYLHEGGNLTGCVYCTEQNVTNLGLPYAIRMSFRAALNYIRNCKECKVKLTLLRTFSPSHFEHGDWNTGGSCNRTSPQPEGEVRSRVESLEVRNGQVEEIERVKDEGKKGGKRFGVLDVTRAMLMRADGHPGAFWGNKWMKGYNDCVHWCLPGPIDAWNDFLMAMLRKEAGL